jgi:hypothetical protein
VEDKAVVLAVEDTTIVVAADVVSVYHRVLVTMNGC